MMGSIEKADTIHKRSILSDMHEGFHFFIVFFSFGFDDLLLPVMPYRLHFLFVFKFETVFVTAFEVKLKHSFALLTFLDWDLLLLKGVGFVWMNQHKICFIELSIGLDPIPEKSLFLNFASDVLHGLFSKEGVNNVVEDDFEALGLKILKVTVLHELFDIE